MEEKAETKGGQTLAEAAGISQMDMERTTLKVWDTPVALAKKFIMTAKSSYANKSWLLLQDLMLKAEKYDEWIASGKIADHENRLAALEDFVEKIQEEADKMADAEEKAKKPKTPKTFGE